MKTKMCRGCGIELPLSEFYKHSQMADGHLNFCKSCVKGRVLLHREKHIEQIREYDRERGKEPHRIEKSHKITKRRRQEVPGYNAAHMKLERAVAKGVIQKPEGCAYCRRSGRLESHHHDYSKPLEVVWLCPACHRLLHAGKTMKAIELRKTFKLPTAN